MSKKQTLIIHGQLPSLNEYVTANRTGAYAGARMKNQVEHAILIAIRQAKLKPVSGPVHMHYTWIEKSKRRDKDNVAAGRKFVQDALVKAAILKNDGWAHIVGFSDAFDVDKHSPRIVVEITEELVEAPKKPKEMVHDGTHLEQ